MDTAALEKIKRLNEEIIHHVQEARFGSASSSMTSLAGELDTLRGAQNRAVVLAAMNALVDAAKARSSANLSGGAVDVYQAASSVLVAAGKAALWDVCRNLDHSDAQVAAAFQSVADTIEADLV